MLLRTFIGLVLATSIFFFRVVENVFAESTVKLGVIVPLTGEAANLGRACQNGLSLAEEAFRATAGNPSFEVVYEDDANIPAQTLTAYRRLAQRRMTAIVSLTSGPSLAIAPLAERDQLPLIAIASDPAVSNGRNFSINFWVTPKEEARRLSAELDARGLRSIARATTNQAAMVAIRDAFDGVSPRRVQVAIDESFDPSVRDFRTFIARLIHRTDIDAVFVNLYLGQAGLFAKQARELGVSLPLVNVEIFDDPAEVASANGALDGQWYVQAEDGVPEFRKLYAQRFAGQTTFGAANCYDALGILLSAAKRNEDTISFLHGLKNYRGMLGQYSANGDNTFSLPATIRTVQTAR